MKIYLAAQYKQKPEIRHNALILRDSGHEVVSSWHLEPHDPNVTLAGCGDALLVEYSERDLSEIRNCEALIFFSVSDLEATKRGGRHVEFGYALAHDKRMIVVGPRENMFHYLPDVEVYPDLATAIKAITR